jgi:hypothetical protein
VLEDKDTFTTDLKKMVDKSGVARATSAWRKTRGLLFVHTGFFFRINTCLMLLTFFICRSHTTSEKGTSPKTLSTRES